MTPEERAERERRELIYRRHVEMQVIQLAIKDHRGCAPEWCGGSHYDPCHLFNAIERLHDYYRRTGSPLAEAFEREAEALVRQLDAASGQHGIDLGDGGRPMVFCADCNTLAMQPHDCPGFPLVEPQYDPLSGDLIPAGQNAELEQWGRDMAEPIGVGDPNEKGSRDHLWGEPEVEHLAMNREQRRLELEVLEANALHYESQTEVSAGRAALDIDGVGTGPVLRKRVSRLADYHGSITHLQTDIDQELSEYRPAPEPEIHTASTVATAELSAALERPMHWGDDDRTACGKFSGMVYQYTGDSRRVTCPECLESGNNQLIWHPRTMKDARKGDQIRPAGSDMPNGTAVTDRYVPAAPGYSDRGKWHVVSGVKHWDDHVVQPGEVWLRLDGAAPRNVDPDFPIEILLTRAEIAAIELLGWDNREELR